MFFDIGIGILAFFFIYNVPIAFLPVSGSKIVVLVLIVWSIFKRKIVFRKAEFAPFAWLVVLIVYASIVVFMNSSGDYSLIYSIVLFIVNHILGAFLFANILYAHGKLSINYVLKLFVYIAVIQSIIILLMMISPDIYQIIALISPLETRNSIYLRYGGARGYGLAQSITYDLAVVQSFALLYIVYLFPSLKRNEIKYYTIFYFAICLSMAVTGRTAIIGLLLSVLLIFIGANKLSRIGLYRALAVFVVAVIILGFGLNYLQNTSIYSSMTKYLLEFRLSGGISSTSTGANILKMFDTFKSIEITSLLFGDGRYRGEGTYYYMNVDVGFFRQIYYFGCVGLVMLLIAYYKIYKTTNNNIFDKRLKKMWFLLLAYVLLANVKGDFMLGCGMAICQLIMIYFASFRDGKHQEIYRQ